MKSTAPESGAGPDIIGEAVEVVGGGAEFRFKNLARLLAFLLFCDGDLFFLSTFCSPLESKVKMNVVVLREKEKAHPDSDKQNLMHCWARVLSEESDIFTMFSELAQVLVIQRTITVPLTRSQHQQIDREMFEHLVLMSSFVNSDF